MAVVAKNLVAGITLTGSVASVLTAQAGTTVIGNGVIANPTSASVSVTIQLQRSGGSAVDLVPPRTVQGNSTDLLPELNGRVLNAGDQILAGGNGLVLVMDGNQL